MIKAIGTDIIEISRIQSAIQKNRHSFLKKIFSPAEYAYYEEKEYPVESIAAGFASKEAVMKVLGTGLRGFSFQDIEILRDDLGKPSIKLSGEALKIASGQGIVSIHLSISHSRDYAIAFAVGE